MRHHQSLTVNNGFVGRWIEAAQRGIWRRPAFRWARVLQLRAGRPHGSGVSGTQDWRGRGRTEWGLLQLWEGGTYESGLSGTALGWRGGGT